VDGSFGRESTYRQEGVLPLGEGHAGHVDSVTLLLSTHTTIVRVLPYYRKLRIHKSRAQS